MKKRKAIKQKKKLTKQQQGKKNRQSGQKFELSVRHDLENKGFIVAKWTNNVSEQMEQNKLKSNGLLDAPFLKDIKPVVDYGTNMIRRLIPAGHKFNPFKKVMSMGTGFPDFIAYKQVGFGPNYIFGVEAKSDGYLDKTEREKVRWLLDNHVFDYLLLAYKGEGGKIMYEKQIKGGISLLWNLR